MKQLKPARLEQRQQLRAAGGHHKQLLLTTPARRAAACAASQQHLQQQQQAVAADTCCLSRRQLLLGGAAVAGTQTLVQGAGTAQPAASSSTPLGIKQRVSEFTLPNGLHFVLLERHAAPVVSCHTHAAVGAFVEEPGSTGLAHLLEHLAFKGTPRIGSKDWPREQALLQAQDEVFYELRQLQRTADASGRSASRSVRMQQLQEQLARLKRQGDELVVPNAFGSLLQQAGAVGLNAATSHDATGFFVSLPSNQLELWFALEAERFQAPVFRQLYTEKEVIGEERRARWENSPLGNFTQSFLMQALDNGYRRPVIGFAEDFDALGSQEVAAFFNTYYHPRNITISIVGDVDPGRVAALAARYFGAWAPAPGAVTLHSGLAQTEPLPRPAAEAGLAALPAAAAASSSSSSGSSSSGSDRTFVQRSAAGPLLALGFPRPSLTGRTGTALEVASDVLSGGRSSRLVRELVMRGDCLSASCLPGYPGDLHPGLALVSAVPQPGGDLGRLSAALQRQLDCLANDGPSAAELARVKASARAALLGAAVSNSSMASLLAAYHAVTGSWRGVLRELDDVESLSGAEVAAVAGAVFCSGSCFTGKALPLSA